MPGLSRAEATDSNARRDWEGKQAQIGLHVILDGAGTSQGLQLVSPNYGFHITQTE